MHVIWMDVFFKTTKTYLNIEYYCISLYITDMFYAIIC